MSQLAGRHGLAWLVGNHLVLQMSGANVFALLAHARTGSIRVQEGDAVRLGQPIAAVGHSGNSSAPHLHFQLMDSADLTRARGLPCCFAQYEAFRDGAWVGIRHGLPAKRELIRRAA